jgi:hypothetical protein
VVLGTVVLAIALVAACQTRKNSNEINIKIFFNVLQIGGYDQYHNKEISDHLDEFTSESIF